MPKIYILGGSGSGKTTLAQEIASRLQIPLYSLDTFVDKPTHQALVEGAIEIARQPGWVAEGIYLLWTDPLLYHADYIVLLDVAWSVAVWRMIYRHITKSLHGTNPYPGLKSFFALLQGSRSYYLNQHRAEPPTAALVRQCLAEQSEVAEPPGVESVLPYLDKYHEIGIPPTAEFVRRYLEKYGKKVVHVKKKADRAHLLEQLTKLSTTQG